MITRRALLKLSATTALGLASGCVTRSMLYDDENYYKENVSNLLITSDGSKIVFIGEKHHYIFDTPRYLVGMLNGNIHELVTAKFGDFSVSDNNRITGSVSLQAKPATEKQKKSIIDLGFSEASLSREIELSGIRYSANIHRTGSSVKLNKPYTVRISEPKGFIERGLKIAVTPITVTVDGALVLFGLPLLLLACSGENSCK